MKNLGKKPSTEQQEKERERVHFETMSNSEEETKVKQKIDEYCQQKLDNMKNNLLSENNLKSLLFRYKLNELILSFHDNYNRKKNNTIYDIIDNDIKKKLVQEPETFERLKSKIKRIVSLQNDNPDLSQDYEKVTREIIKECFETKGYLIQKCLLIAIVTRGLGYIRWLKTEDFMRERSKKRKIKSPQIE
ncbi:hypothetical protein [Lyngbya sp. PCC 8106]|uniref:hypothetical protein n=1 Tax=Lyngbya sp. (strain PCC 8106) TaxID=313612 RepID=UPI0000EAC248|nr:hypothetical protein [Lyngbya sp. PCC 8106]EAW34881.1 hypothetical protein L8106_18547 [Lyngbya sp. PCC 8106]